MSERILNPTKLFPSFEQWTTFLDQQYLRKRSLHEQLNIKNVSCGYITPKGVNNLIDFYNAARPRAIVFKPLLLTQKYTNPREGFEIEVNLNNSDLSNELNIFQSSDYITHITVSSNAVLSKEGKWVNSQQVFMVLKRDYIDKLRAEKIVPKNADSRVWVRRSNEEIKATIGRPMGNELILTEDLLGKICQDAGFKFDFDPIEQVTKGSIGNIDFQLHHARFTALSPDGIWQALTDRSPNPFIFPVQIKGLW